MKREILFRGKPIDVNCEWKWIEGHLCIDYNDIHTIRHPLDTEIGGCRVLVVDPKTIGQFTGLIDKNGIRIFEGDKFLFWVCYPTTQTHTGDNIPNGSYTEPDETQFLKLEAEVVWDEDLARWTYSLLSKVPYQFSQYHNFGWYDQEGFLPIIDRCPYSLDYIKEYYGYEGMSDEEWKEFLSDVGFASELEMMKEINKIEVIGNIHDKK